MSEDEKYAAVPFRCNPSGVEKVFELLDEVLGPCVGDLESLSNILFTLTGHFRSCMTFCFQCECCVALIAKNLLLSDLKCKSQDIS
jgi:hypothetical protein